ncbi:acyl-CoA dehydrogenase family protein [Paraburkholderia sp. J41]|uniref:acyl-CoA dehydrogenase family protein n=1 Tax=Paraburkholderia sp. J41 TaxID=2805433 RepID=UPI002AC35FF1|nr:acyl-CoA dehydrogenase family protein [Paraburkholderia sp. J41]
MAATETPASSSAQFAQQSARHAGGHPAQQALAALPELARTIAEGAASREVRRELPFDAAARFRESGLGRLRLPIEWGGLGGSLEDVFELIATLGAAESNLAHALRLHFDQTEVLLLAPRTPFNDVQIRRVAEGAIFGGASTEVGTARPGEITVQLRRDGEHYRLDGRKYYATGTAFSDYARLNVQDDAGLPVIAIVPVQREGFRVLDDWDGMGQRMTASGGLVFENLLVRADEVAPRVLGSLVGRHTGALRQLHLVAVAAGIVRNIVSDAKHYVINHGRPVLHSPAPTAREDAFIQQVVGELSAHSHAVDALVRDNARVLERQAEAIRRGDADADARVLEGALATARTQLVVSKLALQAAERLFEAGGASATARSHNFDRHWRNLRTIFSHNPLTHKARVIGDYTLNGVTTHLTEGRVF